MRSRWDMIHRPPDILITNYSMLNIMLMRSIENAVYFASVNCAMRFQESATSLIDPDGACIAHVPYGEEKLLVYDLDLDRATGYLAKRFNAGAYPSE
jgi:predicted amidohydrolase